ncbi:MULTISPECIES: Ku protein [unclassified Sinorhizobium]|uniref:non-homologous end joining protein Ku n=1 Tax=unclassified Sinorhizobium TaxID=2613772 RepID=UPI0024C3FBAF|nr:MULTISPECIES: Ku protein [unclassified Sinorhizobium]MDK1375220.1 Ku protein [Sinorhizobium sp. 6-70]MDK1478026.1 Ku protein [Sinorhizobium sp. 6-117]
MPARALWKGQLRLSLVSIPVELFSATRSGASVSFRQIHKPSGKPIHYEKVVEGVGPVDVDDIVKGYEYEDDKYVLLEPKEVDSIKLETKKTLELVQFVGVADISPLYFDKPYYLVPADELAEDAYRVVRDALRQSERIGLGQLTLRGREYLVAVKPCGDGLLLETLRYADELRKADPMFSDISGKKAEKELLEVASALIKKKTAPFDANAFKDNYTAALKELVKRKMKGKSTRVAVEEGERPERRGDNVVDLMSALKKSLESGEGKKPQPKAQSASRRRRKSA